MLAGWTDSEREEAIRHLELISTSLQKLQGALTDLEVDIEIERIDAEIRADVARNTDESSIDAEIEADLAGNVDESSIDAEIEAERACVNKKVEARLAAMKANLARIDAEIEADLAHDR